MHHKNRILMAAIAGILASVNAERDIPQQAFRTPRIRTHKRYPEQSSRQQMRQFRRQQGGSGIVLKEGKYEARSAA